MKSLLSLLLAAALLLPPNASDARALGVSLSEDPIAPGASALGLSQICVETPSFDHSTLTFDPYNQLGTGKQVISAPFTFTNRSDCAVELVLESYYAYTSSGEAVVPQTDPDLVWQGEDKNLLLWLSAAAKDTENQDRMTGEGQQDEYLWPAYIDTEHTGVAFTEFTSGGRPSAPALTVVNQPLGVMRPGTAVVVRDGVQHREPLPGQGAEHTLTLRFDGSMNPAAQWDKGEVLTVVPIFAFRVAE